MNLRDKQWWLGILASFLQGGYSAVAGGVGVSILDPDHFNIHEGLGKLASAVGLSFLGAGIGHAFAYLTKKPLPPTIADELAPDDQASLGEGGLSVAPPPAPVPAPPPDPTKPSA